MEQAIVEYIQSYNPTVYLGRIEFEVAAGFDQLAGNLHRIIYFLDCMNLCGITKCIGIIPRQTSTPSRSSGTAEGDSSATINAVWLTKSVTTLF